MTVQDDRGSRRKAWKAFQANYDDVFSLSDRYCTYCLTEQMVQALLTMTEYLKWPSRWVSAADDIDSDLIDQFASQLEYRLMNGCCDDNLPIQYRYTAEGMLQRSLNGGTDWMDAPLYDPRIYSPQFPPMSGEDGDDKKCIAATGAADLIKEQVGDQLTDDMSRYTLARLISDWVGTMLESSNPFEALMRVISNQIFALVIATLRPALTEGVYDTLKCILFCQMADDATFNDTQWQAVRSDITSQIGGIAGIFLEHLVFLLGTGGLTNLSRAGGAAAGDCDDCDCIEYCYTWDFAVGPSDFATVDWPGGGSPGANYSGGAWHQTTPGGVAGDDSVCWIRYIFPTSVTPHSFKVWFTNGGMTEEGDNSTGMLEAGSGVEYLAGDVLSGSIVFFVYDPLGVGTFAFQKIEMRSSVPLPLDITGGEYGCSDDE